MHSLLFIPANKSRYFENRDILNADAIIVDFQDAIDSALTLSYIPDILRCIENCEHTKFYIRINDVFYPELITSFMDTSKVAGFVIPNFDIDPKSEGIVKFCLDHGYKPVVIIESVHAILHLPLLLEKYSNSIHALMFGSEDYLKSMGVFRSKEALLFPRSYIAMHAKAYSIPCFDSIFPSTAISLDFMQDVQEAKKLGFSGKLAINPKQVTAINTIFETFDLSIEELQRIVNAYNEVTHSTGETIMKYGDMVIEPPHIAFFLSLLKKDSPDKNGSK